MIVNWIILSFQLVVYYESYITVEGTVVYPFAIDGIRFDPTYLDNDVLQYSTEHGITLSKAENRFIVNINPVSNAVTPVLQSGFNIFSFEIREIYSIAGKVIAGIGNTLIFERDVLIFIKFHSENDTKNFFSTELYQLMTAYNSLSDVLLGAVAQNNIRYRISQVLVFTGSEIRRVSYGAMLDTLWLNHQTIQNFRSFHVHDADKGLEFSNVMFTTNKFDIYYSVSVPNRVVVGVWMREFVVVHVCLIFANYEDAPEFVKKVSSQVNPTRVHVEIAIAIGLLQADLDEIEGIML